MNTKRKFILSDGGGGGEPLERILTGLNDVRRRYLLYYLTEQQYAHIAEAAEYIAACELECELGEVPPEAHEDIEIDLFHTHLPYLTDLDLIEYDSRNGDIRFRDPPEKLMEFLELAEATEDVDTPDIETE